MRTRMAFLIAILASCAATSTPAPDAGLDHNAECCRLWADPDDPDQHLFLAACSPTTPDTCITYACDYPQPVAVCTGGAP